MTQALQENAAAPAAPQLHVPADAGDGRHGHAPVKVLFFYQDFGAMGGIERYLIQTAGLLRARGEVEPVFACSRNTPLYDSLRMAGFKVYGLNNWKLLGRSILRTFDIFTLARMTEILREEQPDAVHVHIGTVENLLFQLMGFPVVYTVHGYSTLYSMQGVTRPLKKTFKKLVRALFRENAERMDKLLFVSHAERERMISEGYVGPDKAGEVLHNGVSVAELQRKVSDVNRETLRESLDIPPNARVVSFINRMDSNKNPLRFVSTARKLLQDPAFEDLHFIMVGDGPLLETVRKAASDVSRFHVLGYLPDVSEVLAISDLIIHPARYEGFGLGIVEALAAGVPCVAYASGGAMEILGEGQTAECLVPIDNAEALLRNAKRVLSLPADEKAKLRETLKQRAEAFDSQRFIERLEKIYQEFTPKVSVILPVYNGEDTILRAARSVLNQTYPHLELIVVDDGSDDDTLALLATIRDSRLKIFRQENQGVAVARNTGFGHSNGNYIAFIDADDCWMPEKLAVEMAVIRKHAGPEKPSIIYSGYYAMNDYDNLTHLPPVWREVGDLSEDVLQHEGIFLPSTALVHRTVFETVGGFKTDCYHEDRVFFIEACRKFPAFPTGQRLVAYRQSMGGRCRRILQDYDEALSAELSIVETLKPVLPETKIAELSRLQMRNLLFRFLMYGEFENAQRIHEALQSQDTRNGLFVGKKGLLAKLSLRTGINFMISVRLLMQGATRVLLMPWWLWKTRSFR